VYHVPVCPVCALDVDGASLKRILREIEPDARDSGEIPERLAHSTAPFRWVDDNDHLGALAPFGAPSTLTAIARSGWKGDKPVMPRDVVSSAS